MTGKAFEFTRCAIVQSNSAILLELREILSGPAKVLRFKKPLSGLQEAPQQNPYKSELKEMCYSTRKYDTHVAHSKYCYLGFP